MPLQKVKPTSAGRRSLVKVVNPHLHKGKPVDALTESQKRGSGRNNNGHITTRHKGGGHKHHGGGCHDCATLARCAPQPERGIACSRR